MSDLTGKNFVVTGAAGGIGYAVCRRIVNRGGRVLLVDRDEAALGSALSELGENRAAILVADVSQSEDNESIARRAVEQFGTVDGAVLNVGIPGELSPIVETDVAAFDKVISVNVRGTWLGLKHLIPEISKCGEGSIVLTGSTAGFRAGAPGRSAYVCSKHAVIGLMRAAAAECAPLGVRVNSVSPGGVRTQMTESVKTLLGQEQGEAVIRKFEESIPMKRLAEPDEIASVIVFLLGSESRYCTAINIMVDGGLLG